MVGKAVKATAIGIDPDLVKEGYNYIVKFQSKCKKKGDNKLASRYQLLKNYFDTRLHLWGVRGS